MFLDGEEGKGAKQCKIQQFCAMRKMFFILLAFFVNNKTKKGPPAKRGTKREGEKERGKERERDKSKGKWKGK